MNRSGKVLKMLCIFLPAFILIGFSILLINNYFANTLEHVETLSNGKREGDKYIFDDITVEVSTRGGDSGSWETDEMWDDGYNIKYFDQSVGTIYEIKVINNTQNTINDWTAKIFIPEDMCVDNSWNGDFEYHQGVLSGDEKVQTMDLADYSKYDITLDYFIGPSGPMIWLYKGDYFIYYPDEAAGDVPLTAKPDDPEKDSSATIGFIMYIENQKKGYVADFSSGEIHYHMQVKLVKNPLFWVMSGVVVIWISCVLAMVILKLNLRRLLELQKRDEKIIEQTMQTIVNFIEAKDPSTMGHSVRVAQYSRLLAESMGFSEDECKRVYYIALMHDCGKIYIPDNILSKPARLTDEEYETMKKHTVYGAEILRDFTSIDDIGLGALSHHERWDGKGYPNGISGENIPLIARIICVSDAFDAMNSRRCYRSSLSSDVILNELENNKGKQFDPEIVDHLLKLIEYGAVTLTNKKTAENNN